MTAEVWTHAWSFGSWRALWPSEPSVALRVGMKKHLNSANPIQPLLKSTFSPTSPLGPGCPVAPGGPYRVECIAIMRYCMLPGCTDLLSIFSPWSRRSGSTRRTLDTDIHEIDHRMMGIMQLTGGPLSPGAPVGPSCPDGPYDTTESSLAADLR